MEQWLNPVMMMVGIGLVIGQCYRLTAEHRRQWGIRLISPQRLSVAQVLCGLLVGGLLSVLFIVGNWHFGLNAGTSWWIWALLLVLGLIRMQWMGIGYAAGCLALIALLNRQFGWSDIGDWPASLGPSVEAVRVAGLLGLTGILYILHGVLVCWRGDRAHHPTLIPKRGKAVGSFMLQSLWAVPILLPTPDGWFLFPVLLTYTDVSTSRLPLQRARLTGLWICGFGLLLTLLSWASAAIPAFLWIGAVWAILGMTLVRRFSRRQESTSQPKFRISDTGIQVLSVQEDSPAAQMGVQSGECIKTVNDHPVHNMDELYAALQISPAYCKLEVVGADGEIKIVQRSLYADEPHHLGLIAVDETGQPASSPMLDRLGWWALFQQPDYRKRSPQHTVTRSEST